jgi:hypothetical protein
VKLGEVRVVQMMAGYW